MAVVIYFVTPLFFIVAPQSRRVERADSASETRHPTELTLGKTPRGERLIEPLPATRRSAMAAGRLPARAASRPYVRRAPGSGRRASVVVVVRLTDALQRMADLGVGDLGHRLARAMLALGLAREVVD